MKDRFSPLRWGGSLLKSRSVPEATACAEFLLAHVLGVGRGLAVLSSERPLTAEQARRFRGLIRRKAGRIPLAYLLGTQPFVDFDLRVGPGVLIPRPETEELAIKAAELLKREEIVCPRVIDLGTGSGCLAVALANLVPGSRVCAIEKSRKALALARENARSNGVAARVRFVQDDFLKPKRRLPFRADLLISNPPYIASAEIASLEREVRREPRQALDGGPDGLRHLRGIIGRAGLWLKPRGWIALEFGFGQAKAVRGLLKEAGFGRILIERDAQGLERLAFAKLEKC